WREIIGPHASGTLSLVHARSALFDLYGDHLRRRGAAAQVAVLVRLLSPLGVAAPAVRTAVSRMVRQGWLAPAEVAGGPGYALTTRAEQRLDAAHERIYRTRVAAWDGGWDVVLVDTAGSRAARDRLAAGLRYLGYAPLRPGTWISPRGSAELDALLAAEGASAERFTARSEADGAALAARAWDLPAIAGRYREFEHQVAPLLVDARDLAVRGDGGCDERAYVVRSTLLHEWRKLLFVDPGLPPALLPPGWDGERVAARFDAAAGGLAPAADRFVQGCLGVPEPTATTHLEAR
ncbi:MAG: PaaX family transcriptional regulator C-terminal domain-containing protein, partial [Actinomycetota bacterium]